ncbi:MAG: Rieske (2Fe-2S) protein [Planctomycetes bacterium]|nr:Rieske (2Fe-2S) protein [Planctomycetota bacterium]
MSLTDDLNEPLSDAEVTRRKLLLALGGGALAAAGLGAAITTLEYMKPNVLFEPATRFPVGRPEEIAPGSVLALPRQKVYVVRGPAGIYAMSSVCTHLGCIIQHRRAAGQKEGFFCPCHGSAFDLEGKVVGGPAPRPLDRLDVKIEGGKLVVDTQKKVPPTTVLEV